MSNPNMQPSQLGFIGDFLSSDCGAKLVSISITFAIIFGESHPITYHTYLIDISVIASYYQLWTVAIICLGAVIILPIIVAACLIVSDINCHRVSIVCVRLRQKSAPITSNDTIKYKL